MSVDRFSRSRILYGDAAQARFEKARVAVCGAGAVGGFAIEALARIGVGHFYIFDFDTVDISNINRQLCALQSTIGMKKAQLAKARILDINPEAKVEVFDMFLDEANINLVADLKPDVVVDAIDSLSSKAALIKAAIAAGVPIVSSMGAARKTDPAQVFCSKLSKSINCPMAAKLRKKLRRDGVKPDCMCVFSKELPSGESHMQSGGDGKTKVIGSTPIVTGVFGLRLAGLAADELLKEGAPQCGPQEDLK